MRNTSFTSLRVIMAAVSLLSLVTVTLTGYASNVDAVSTEATNEHLITIHDRDVDRSVISSKSTLREVFKDADIFIDPNDIVEPGLDEKLVASSYQVNVYRARPVTIVDGPSKTRVMSAYQTPKQIVEHAGMTLRSEDDTSFGVSDDFITDGASLILNIDRATPVNLILYGKRDTIYTQSTTVAELLKEKSITLEASDTMSLTSASKITPNMELQIWRNGVQTLTQDEAIEAPVETIQDTNREVGYKQVTESGKPGKKSVTYEVNIQNGQEISRKEIQSVVVEQPTKQVVVVGAKQKSFGGSCGEWMAGAGITDTSNATYLINAESGCNPYAVNKSSGACGVGQALPCSKTGCEMGDGACQTRWMNSYVMGRYGSWANAANHHRAKGWY